MIAFILLLLLVGCQPFLAETGVVRIAVHPTGLRTQAASKRPLDVHHVTVKLFRQADNGLCATGTLPAASSAQAEFGNLPDGTYYATAEAFESADDSVSITQGGPQASANTVTVTAPTATYSDSGSSLAISLPLLNGTGGTATVTFTTSLNPMSYHGWLQDETAALKAPYTSNSPSFRFGFIPDGTFGAVGSLSPAAGYSTPSRVAAETLTFVDGAVSPSSPFSIDLPGLLTTVGGGAGIGDGGPASLATLNGPQKIAVSAGVLYIADSLHHRIRRVAGGIISTYAGTGTAGYSGDGASALVAQLNDPTGLALDGSGNLYVADTGNRVVRLITPAGVISTVAGNGQNGAQGDGGPATDARLSSPSALAIAGGDLFIADTGNNKVRKVDAAGIITTFAGRGQPGYTGDGASPSNARLKLPEGLAAAGGILYIADTGNHVIRQVAGGTITTVPANSAFNGPKDVAVDGQDLLVADTGNQAICRIAGGNVTTEVGGGALVGPSGLAWENGTLYLADSGDHQIKRLVGGTLASIAGHPLSGPDGDNGPAAAATLSSPQGVTGDATGTLWVSDSGHHRIRQISNEIITAFAGSGTAGFSGDGGPAGSARFNQPQALAIAPNGDLFVADTGNHRIRRIQSGTVGTVAGDGSTAVLNGPMGLAIAPNGDLFIADTGNHLIKKWSGGVLSVVAGDGSTAVLNGPTGLAIAPNGDLFVADTGNQRVQVLSIGSLAVVADQLNAPKGLVLGKGGELLIADSGSHRLLRRDASGSVTVVAGTGLAGLDIDGMAAFQAAINQPHQLWSGPMGQLIFCDTLNHRLRLI